MASIKFLQEFPSKAWSRRGSHSLPRQTSARRQCWHQFQHSPYCSFTSHTSNWCHTEIIYYQVINLTGTFITI